MSGNHGLMTSELVKRADSWIRDRYDWGGDDIYRHARKLAEEVSKVRGATPEMVASALLETFVGNRRFDEIRERFGEKVHKYLFELLYVDGKLTKSDYYAHVGGLVSRAIRVCREAKTIMVIDNWLRLRDNFSPYMSKALACGEALRLVGTVGTHEIPYSGKLRDLAISELCKIIDEADEEGKEE